MLTWKNMDTSPPGDEMMLLSDGQVLYMGCWRTELIDEAKPAYRVFDHNGPFDFKPTLWDLSCDIIDEMRKA
jgi:hypothetical protein